MDFIVGLPKTQNVYDSIWVRGGRRPVGWHHMAGEGRERGGGPGRPPDGVRPAAAQDRRARAVEQTRGKGAD
jgi:hypothetical protein